MSPSRPPFVLPSEFNSISGARPEHHHSGLESTGSLCRRCEDSRKNEGPLRDDVCLSRNGKSLFFSDEGLWFLGRPFLTRRYLTRFPWLEDLPTDPTTEPDHW